MIVNTTTRLIFVASNHTQQKQINMAFMQINSTSGEPSEFLSSRAVEACLCLAGRQIENWHDIDRLSISDGGEYRLEWAGNVEAGIVFQSAWAVFGEIGTGRYAVLREISVHSTQICALMAFARLRKEWAGDGWRTATHVAEVWKTA